MFWQVWSNIYWNISGKLTVKIQEASYTESGRTFSAKFLKIFRSQSQNFWMNIFRILEKYLPKDYKKCCEIFPLSLHWMFPKLFWNILCMVWTEGTNIPRNLLASLEQHLLKYFRQASCEDSWNLTQKIFQSLFCKVSRNIQISITRFSTNISTSLQKYFPKDYKKCCVKIPTIITGKVSETFPKYFVYGLWCCKFH